jgi:DNA-directed RNA polymerase specialized sigma24 family protein
MLRYFAGLSPEETAESMDVSLRTIEREWRYCKAWLRREMRGEDDPGDPE